MLGIEISALSVAELRQLLTVARAREQHALVEQLTAELRMRPARSARLATAQPWTASLAVEDEPVPPRRRSLAVALTAGAAGVLAAALLWGVSVPPTTSMTPVKIALPRAAVALAEPQPIVVEDTTAEVVARPSAAARPAANPCYDLPTPADRLVCGYPSLGDRERLLRSAYRAAIAAGADPRALEDEQTAWKAGRDGVSDRLALADLYDQRIRELSEAAP